MDNQEYGGVCDSDSENSMYAVLCGSVEELDVKGH